MLFIIYNKQIYNLYYTHNSEHSSCSKCLTILDQSQFNHWQMQEPISNADQRRIQHAAQTYALQQQKQLQTCNSLSRETAVVTRTLQWINLNTSQQQLATSQTKQTRTVGTLVQSNVMGVTLCAEHIQSMPYKRRLLALFTLHPGAHTDLPVG